jgi:mRNA-degrading endonuclease RelE of RelBE toxin-antitoxin system
MAKRKRFRIHYTRDAKVSFRSIDRRHYGLIRGKVDEQLSFEPDVETTNRKPLMKPIIWGENVWELRFGPDNCFRVFYELDADERAVTVYAIGVKTGNRLSIGGEEHPL